MDIDKVVEAYWDSVWEKLNADDPWDKYMDIDAMIDLLNDGHGGEETQAWIEDRLEDDDLMTALWNRSNYLGGVPELQGMTKDDAVADRVRAFLEANWDSEALWWEMWYAIPDRDCIEIAKRCIEREDYRDEFNAKMRGRGE